MRKVVYISGTRADFGLMQNTLTQLNSASSISISVIVTGMHLSAVFGLTVNEIEASSIPISGRVETVLEPATGATMVHAIATMITGFTDLFEKLKPDVILLLGDRGEMLAAAIAAVHLNIAVTHIHGGERSGTVDELVRHAISKLSHVHCVATEQSRQRLISMGENKDRVFVTGAPGLDELHNAEIKGKADLFSQYALNQDESLALFLYHPVLQEADGTANQTGQILNTLLSDAWQVLALMPNSDAGSMEIRTVLQTTEHPSFRSVTHLPRSDFISFMAHADVMVGNSSAGIIEAASFGTPVINIGTRQNYRERNKNVRDVGTNPEEVALALKEVRQSGRFPVENVYGDGNAGLRICDVLNNLEVNSELLNKVMAY